MCFPLEAIFIHVLLTVGVELAILPLEILGVYESNMLVKLCFGRQVPMSRRDTEHGRVDAILIKVLTFVVVGAAEATAGGEVQVDEDEHHSGQAAHESGVGRVEVV